VVKGRQCAQAQGSGERSPLNRPPPTTQEKLLIEIRDLLAKDKS